jgi:ankyrin repeat protein
MSNQEIEPNLTSSFSTRNEGAKNQNIQVEKFIETFFAEGSLGVTLRRRPDDGIVFIHEVIPGSQAVDLDVQPYDELWAVGDSEIGETPLDKEAWNGLINFIKASSRPLRLVWHRKPASSRPPMTLSTPTSPGPSSVASSVPVSPGMITPGTHVPFPPSQVPQPVTEPVITPEYADLQRVLSRIIVKDNDTKSKKISPMSLLSEKRKILRQGDLTIHIKNSTLWSKKQETRKVILMNDYLLTTIPQSTGNISILEFVFELPTCKLRSLGHVFGVGDCPDVIDSEQGENEMNIEDLQFDIITPTAEITFSALSKEIKEVWVLNIYIALCECVGESERVIGWRHQYMLGTMHSAVICRDEQRIRDLIVQCESGKISFLSVEAADEDGYTPLHYACILRLHSIIGLLHEATADVTALDRQGWTPLHWSAMQLDEYALSLLCQHVFDIDLYDTKQRTPLILCCIEGRDMFGKSDPILMKLCLEHMLSHKPSVQWQDKQGRNIFHYLAASWQYEALELLVEYLFENSMDDLIHMINAIDKLTGLTPLHYAIQGRPIKKKINEAMRVMNRHQYLQYTNTTNITTTTPTNNNNNNTHPEIPSSTNNHHSINPLLEVEELHRPHGVDTIRILLKAGARPNVRDYQGQTSLMILLMDPDIPLEWHEREEILPAIAILLSFGARMEADPQILPALRNLYPDILVGPFMEKWASLNHVDCHILNIK